MPILQPSPYDALAKLLGASSDLNADDSNGMIANESRASDNIDELKQHLALEKEFPHTYFASAKAPTALAKQTSDLANGPNFGDAAQQQVDAVRKANNAALAAGYVGDTDIAGPASGGDQMGERLYANVGNRTPLSPAGMMGQANAANERLKVEAPIIAAREKSIGDILTAREKAHAEGDELIRTNKALYDLRNGHANGEQAPGATTAPTTPPPPTQAGSNLGAPQAPAQPQSFLDRLKSFATNSDKTPYNGLSDYLGARGSSMLSSLSAQPESSAIQENLLGNAQALAGIFPSSRAAGVLSKIAQEFQSNYGHETPAASYLRLHNQLQALKDAETEFDDPAYIWKTSANGRLEPAATNQTIQRAKIAVQTSRATLERAKQQMESLHPGIQAVIPGQQPAMSPAQSRFERIQ